ncbi:pupal cuticle protein Edg-84A-like [Ostrinia furnacalis]|uniref:pupal cuticle protein Edg-84A-like n=1 Tax=Ostrinia furnacalis TaxID=93504 RepID=UPI00104005E9|nr:pupal cuticle protein Edg-84A-like [Ostrinia furnacalis]
MDHLHKVVLLLCLLGGQARVLSPSRQARLTLAEPMPSYYVTNVDGHPGTYAFGYDVHDPQTGNTQFRTEERYPNGTVVGSYGYVDGNGRPHRYNYVADEKGYRLMTDVPRQPEIPRPIDQVANMEPSVTWSRPKKPNRKTENKSYFTRIPVRKDIAIQNSILHPPSYYGSYK